MDVQAPGEQTREGGGRRLTLEFRPMRPRTRAMARAEREAMAARLDSLFGLLEERLQMDERTLRTPPDERLEALVAELQANHEELLDAWRVLRRAVREAREA